MLRRQESSAAASSYASPRWSLNACAAQPCQPRFVPLSLGYEIEVFSENGGQCEPDAMSDPVSRSVETSSLNGEKPQSSVVPN
jgi:hypothetical protein